MHSNERVAERIREERKRLGLSQQSAAEMAGVRREMWSKYEAGSEPGAQALAGIAMAGADIHYVLTGERGGGLLPEEQLMLRYFREASKDTRKAALGALLGATIPTQIGGTHSQHSTGDGAIQIGTIGGGAVARKRR